MRWVDEDAGRNSGGGGLLLNLRDCGAAVAGQAPASVVRRTSTRVRLGSLPSGEDSSSRGEKRIGRSSILTSLHTLFDDCSAKGCHHTLRQRGCIRPCRYRHDHFRLGHIGASMRSQSVLRRRCCHCSNSYHYYHFKEKRKTPAWSLPLFLPLLELESRAPLTFVACQFFSDLLFPPVNLRIF